MNDSQASIQYLNSIPELAPLFPEADHVDAKTIEGNNSLREFLARLITYSPGWLRLLFRIRGVLVRLLGMRQAPMEEPTLKAEDISFTPGDAYGFFTVTHGKEDAYLVAASEDKHLRAHIIIASESLKKDAIRFHVGTVVHYKHWTGPAYFNIIRPFHHLVVYLMMRHAAGNSM